MPVSPQSGAGAPAENLVIAARSIPLPTDTAPTVDLRRPYSRPRLTIHGDVQRLTHKIGSDLDADGGSFTPELPLESPSE